MVVNYCNPKSWGSSHRKTPGALTSTHTYMQGSLEDCVGKEKGGGKDTARDVEIFVVVVRIWKAVRPQNWGVFIRDLNR